MFSNTYLCALSPIPLWFYSVFRDQYWLSSEQTENSVGLPWVLCSPWGVFQNLPGTGLPHGRSSMKEREAYIGLWWANSTIMEELLLFSLKRKPCHCVCSVCSVNSPNGLWRICPLSFSSYSSLSQRLLISFKLNRKFWQLSCCLKVSVLPWQLSLRVEEVKCRFGE